MSYFGHPGPPNSSTRRRVFDRAELLEVSEDFAVARWDHVLIVVWRKQTLAADVHAVRRHWGSMAQQLQEGILYLTLVESQAPPPDNTARAALADFLNAAKGSIAVGAVVLEGTSLRSAFVRGVATGLVLLARTPIPFHPTSFEGAVAHFATHARREKIPFRAAELGQVVAQLREDIETHFEPPLLDVGTDC